MTRPLSRADVHLLESLQAACHVVDGGRRASTIEWFGPDGAESPPATHGVFSDEGDLIAAASVRLAHRPDCYQALMVGTVDPAHRGKGFGRDLLAWSIRQAESLLVSLPPDRRHLLCATTESLTTDAERLYARFGLHFSFAEDVMWRSLDDPLPDRPFPPDVTVRSWLAPLASAFFTAYTKSFRDRQGFPGWPEQQWIEWATGDEQFHPNASLLACRGSEPIGLIVADAGKIVQVGVRPEARGEGVGGALCVEAMRRLRAEGCHEVELDVNINNPTARRLYEGLGFQPVGRRARYEREA